ncbi:sensor histidine kinase [Paenibacillus dendritiformis]|uniref:sensor histidine kinase n=1 Tax=Paenibacillus dendritiformis TaxID=130049 RepID=UPI0031F4B880
MGSTLDSFDVWKESVSIYKSIFGTVLIIVYRPALVRRMLEQKDMGRDAMLYYFLSLLTAAIILLGTHPRKETNRWAALFLSSASIGGLAELLAKNGLPGWSGPLQFLNQTLTPYGVLVFSMVYAERFPQAETRRLMKWLLLLPVAVMLAVTPFHPVPALDFRLLLVWTGPYYLLSCYWLVASLWNETDRRKKRSRLIVTLIVVPTLLAVLVFINGANAFALEIDFFRYISVFIIYSLGLGLLCSFLYGVLGVKLRFERDPLENTMKAVSSGAALLNHTIKNEIGKIAISSENLRRALPEGDEPSRQHLEIISRAADHMQAMVTRIHSQMKDVVLREEPCQLDRLAEASLAQHELLFASRHIAADADYVCRPLVLCDAVHMTEALGNLLRNAVEAMPDGGAIRIKIEDSPKGVRLSVQDTGTGMSPEQLARGFEPFYSTKGRRDNFGLGLSYVYNVMQKSGGEVNIASKEGGGTCVTLQFPRRATISRNGGNRHESD